LSAIGCDIALADLWDPAALGRAIATAEAVQVILPPPLQARDAPGDMRRCIESLAEALERTHPKRVLAISDYGAHVREDVGMPTMYQLFEERLRRLDLPKIFLRSAEHMESWAPFIPVANGTGILPSLHHPVDGAFPTISARDVGAISADLLLHPRAGTNERIVHAEGPRRYAAADVASALSQLLGRTVIAQALPRSQWRESLGRVVSESTVDLLVKLYDAHNRGGLIDVEDDKSEVRYGTTDLIGALQPFIPPSSDIRPEPCILRCARRQR
jgi:uncharacterized protein YbjT (DUF2867 family)